MLEDPRLNCKKVRVHRQDNYERRRIFSATIHPDIKCTLVAMSQRTGMSVSQVTDEVLYTGLIEMQELPELEYRGLGGAHSPLQRTKALPNPKAFIDFKKIKYVKYFS